MILDTTNSDFKPAITVAVGTPEQREIEIKRTMQAHYIGGRFWTISEFVNNEGYCLQVNNKEDKTVNQSLWLSEITLKALFLSIMEFMNAANMSLDAEEILLEDGPDVRFSEGFDDERTN